MPMLSKEQLIELLHTSQSSCVITNKQSTLTFHERGVKDLHRLLGDESHPLNGAFIADKVVGKGAAALMIAGGARWIYAKIISEAALELFSTSQVEVEYNEKVPNIINRSGTDICPIEKLCLRCTNIEECLIAINNFLECIK